MLTKMGIVAMGLTLIVLILVVVTASPTNTTTDQILANETTTTEMQQCQHPLTRPKGLLDYTFWKKFFKHWNPFTSKTRVKMQFYLFKRDFPDCGKELLIGDDELLAKSNFDARHPTRIIVHGWMSQAHGSLNRDVKNAYLSLTHGENPLYPDFNVIVCDWSMISSNVNYFGVADMIEDLGFLLAEFVRHLHMRADLHYDDVYVIGHSLGAQIAGSAGKQIKPYRFNTIFALDPAGPKFREQSDDYRIDASDAHYVESIQTSVTFGFEQPVGHATFYPNYGKNQKKCYVYGCSHKRAHHYFAESITSPKGFWGIRCERLPDQVWVLLDNEGEFRMGGEPSLPKNGTFYVKTNSEPPYAMGHRTNVDVFQRREVKVDMNEETDKSV